MAIRHLSRVATQYLRRERESLKSVREKENNESTVTLTDSAKTLSLALAEEERKRAGEGAGAGAGEGEGAGEGAGDLGEERRSDISGGENSDDVSADTSALLLLARKSERERK
jgi:hypothetical protein